MTIINLCCVKDTPHQFVARGHLVAKPTFITNIKLSAKLKGTGSISATTTKTHSLSVKMVGSGSINTQPVVNHRISAKISGSGSISAKPKRDMVIKKSLVGTGTISSYLDKYTSMDFFNCLEKLYPVADAGASGIVSSGSLFEQVDEGVFTGPPGDSERVSDDNTFIYTSGDREVYSAAFQMSRPSYIPLDSDLRMRIFGPDKNSSYQLQNIRFVDSSGDLIFSYKDTEVFGDYDYYNVVIPPKRNNIKYQWQESGADFSTPSGYVLSFDIIPKVLNDGSFTKGMDGGFEEFTSLYGDNAVKISAIEICSSGVSKTDGKEQYVPFYAEVDATGNRVERNIIPTQTFYNTYENGLYPGGDTVWQAQDGLDNTTCLGLESVRDAISSQSSNSFITLQSSEIEDSGRLVVKFGQGGRNKIVERGSFGHAFDQSLNGIWYNPSGAFETLTKTAVEHLDNYYVVDSITLVVTAKKAVGSRDYSIDVVGYSDDKLLNITSPSGGFLQSVNGAGTIPTQVVSGELDDLGLSTEVIFNKDQLISNQDIVGSGYGGGDHYLLSSYPVINSTEFQSYEIPLKILDEEVELGLGRKYNFSSMLESLYLDLYPIPSGASIANIELLVRYAPQNALNLMVEGGEFGVVTSNRSEGSFFPTVRGDGEEFLNAGSGYGPISNIENIPHGYGSGETLKSNYSRRWRGNEGTVYGPFDVDQFDFGFENTSLDFPFLSGYYNFTDIDGSYVKSVDLGPYGTASGLITGGLETHRNLGMRFIDESMFTVDLPGYSSDYKTADWTALSNGGLNFTTDPLYGKIADAYDAVARIGENNHVDFGNIDTSSGYSVFVRFIPDAGSTFNDDIIFTKNNGTTTEFLLKYEGDYLKAECDGNSVTDTKPYNEYQYPISVLVTYNDNGSGKLKLYTDNDSSQGAFTYKRGESSSFSMTPVSDGNIYLGNNDTGGMKMLVTDFGISTFSEDIGTNIVESSVDRTIKEVTAEEIFNNIRSKYFDPSESYQNDTFKLWDYINEPISSGWKIGAFDYRDFNYSFDTFTKRSGRDFVSFNILNSGLAYQEFVDSFPSNMNSGVSYHSQIENDFLRFHLSDSADNFNSINRRITKNLPYGYKFNDTALYVDTIIEHTSSGSINWDCGQEGPKLIVSLYTKNQASDGELHGLINRDIHFLSSDVSDRITRVESKFTYDSICDETELWSVFEKQSNLKEFKTKYYSQDIDDMFLQYDVVYPSGPEYSSSIKIHSANVRADDVRVSAVDVSGSMNLMTSGNPSPVSGQLDLYSFGASGIDTDSMNLFAGSTLINDSFNLNTSGELVGRGEINLYSIASSTISESGFNLIASGDGRVYTSQSNSLGLFTYPHAEESGILPLTIINTDTTFVPGDTFLPMTTYVSETSGADASRSTFGLFAQQSVGAKKGADNQSINLISIGESPLVDRVINNNTPLFIFSNNPSENLPLYLRSESGEVSESGSVNLVTSSYDVSTETAYVSWDGANYGVGTEVDDEPYITLAASDEIRGVDLTGYGDCDGDSTSKAIDAAITTDGIVWREETCNEGGAFRAKATYTNTDIGYSGNYYGIRKYSGLYPNTAYDLTMEIETGSTEGIPVPNNFEEFEYGSNSSLNYSGIKTVSENRAENDRFGFSSDVCDDLMVIGAPNRTVADSGGNDVSNAGTAFLFRRGTDTPGQKAPWNLEKELILPSGFVSDYITYTVENLISFDDLVASGQKWAVGQQGRNLGYSVSVANSGDREVVVAGAPGAQWDRTFTEPVTSGISPLFLLFTDKFDRDTTVLDSIADTASQWDILYKYFSVPWDLAGGSWQPELEVKMIVCHIITPDQVAESSEFDSRPYKGWMEHVFIENLNNSSDVQQSIQTSVSGIQEKFFSLYPHDTSKIHSNIPPIVGYFTDTSPSTQEGSASDQIAQSFINFYKEYAFVSGVVDISTDTPSSGYVKSTRGDGFDWSSESIDLINDTLSTGNLIENDALTLITSGVGSQYADTSISALNIPPESGGRVFIFENENDSFNLVQEIISPEESQRNLSLGISPNDRFGHSVCISKNGEIITVGSPYSDSQCRVYERNESAYTDLYEGILGWVSENNQSALSYYNSVLAVSGISVARQQTYEYLSEADKFSARKDIGVQQYNLVYSFSNENIPYTGGWKFMTEEFASTSRLGYSSAVNEDGTVVAFGAPTDSFDENDDTNVWQKEKFTTDEGVVIEADAPSTWPAYAQAGAVRLFQSRNYFPHDKVVEFFKFGNLDETAHPECSNFYNQFGLFFDKEYERTQFDNIEIPSDAGLAFVITPEIDAASDEIVENIKDWLRLGDRTLVLVGNDPIWEEDGLYADSNEIINKILEKLDSNMRIVAARNKEESLQGCVSSDYIASGWANVTAAKLPTGASRTVSPYNVFANGVGDVRIDLSKYGKQDFSIDHDCSYDNICGTPLKHLGDLRSSFDYKFVDPLDNEHPMSINWAWQFDKSRDDAYDFYDSYESFPYKPQLSGQYPVAIMTTAELIPGETITIPEIVSSSVSISREPVVVGYREIGDTKEIVTGYESSPSFYLYEDSNDFAVSSGLVSSVLGSGTGFNPAGSTLFQVSGVTGQYRTETITEDRTLCVAAREQYSNTSSDVIVMSNIKQDSRRNMGKAISSNQSTTNDDKNIYFFNNLVQKECTESAVVLQIGGFGGSATFADADSDSFLDEFFEAYGYELVNNYNITNESSIRSDADVIWIYNPTSTPSESDVEKIKDWMTLGNKKAIISYSNDNISASAASEICQKLGLTLSPLVSDGEYSKNRTGLGVELEYVTSDISLSGCVGGYGYNDITKSTHVEELSLENSVEWIPMVSGANTQPIIHYNYRTITTNKVPVNDLWTIQGSKQYFFEVPETGYYSVYFDFVRNQLSDAFPLEVNYGVYGYDDSGELISQPVLNSVQLSQGTSDITRDGQKIGRKYLTDNIGSTLQTGGPDVEDFVDVKVDQVYVNGSYYDASGVVVNVRCDQVFSTNWDNPDFLKTQQPFSNSLVGISGVKGIPANVTVTQRQEIIEYVEKETSTVTVTPEKTVTTETYIKPYETSAEKYCTSGCDASNMVEDGPVVVAEEGFSEFENGSSRSKIVLITDSSILQGCCGDYRDNGSQSSNIQFIQSLYPQSPNKTSGRNFGEEKFKLVAPERGSAAKYFSVSGDASLVSRYGSGSAGSPERYDYSGNDLLTTSIERPIEPSTSGEFANARNNFLSDANSYGVFPRYTGIIDGKDYTDATISERLPELLIDKGYDYIDIEMIGSGYAGDLFGYSISLSDNKLIVGAPGSAFIGEDPVTWSGIVDSYNANNISSGLLLTGNGGAGAAYLFEKSDTQSWRFTKKIKPNTDIDNLQDDLFGFSTSMYDDFLVVGSPKHDFGVDNQETFGGSSAFIRKEFNAEFDIPSYTHTDVSGDGVVNNGAAYVFRNNLTDFESRTQQWQYAQKLISQGYGGRHENELFGVSVGMDKPLRGDSDYSFVVGALGSKYSDSSSDPSVVESGGAGYQFDAMLREQTPSLANSGNWIDASVFGDGDVEINDVVFQNASGSPETSLSSGVIFTNDQGEIFLEVSGVDVGGYGFIGQRPYVKSVTGQVKSGTELNNSVNLFASGSPVGTSGDMNMVIIGPDSANVYNSVGLVGFGIEDFGSGSMNLMTSVASGDINNSLNLNLKSDVPNGQLNLRTRGK